MVIYFRGRRGHVRPCATSHSAGAIYRRPHRFRAEYARGRASRSQARTREWGGGGGGGGGGARDAIINPA